MVACLGRRRKMEKSGVRGRRAGTIKRRRLPESAIKKDPSYKRNAGGRNKEKISQEQEVCKVTFTLPGTVAGDAEDVRLVGDFNNWDAQSNPMRKLRNGDYRIDMDLYPGSEYQFRYLINGSRWENAWNADKYVKTPYGDADNSVIVI